MIYDTNALLKVSTITEGIPARVSKKGEILRQQIPPLIDISRDTFLKLVDDNVFPKPVTLGSQKFWRYGDLKNVIEEKYNQPKPA